MFQRSWVQIPAPYTGWTFFTFICCKNCNVWLKDENKFKKEAGVGPFFLKKIDTLTQSESEWDFQLSAPKSNLKMELFDQKFADSF